MFCIEDPNGRLIEYSVCVYKEEGIKKVEKEFGTDWERLQRSGYKVVMVSVKKIKGDCPKCQGPSKWRSGVEFENQKICIMCHHTWAPN